MKVFCNPLNLPYRYQMRGPNALACREAADPTLVFFKGLYYLFPSMTAGFYTSTDLLSWTFHAFLGDVPVNDYAPDVCVLGDELQYCASHASKHCSFYRTHDPLTEPFREIPGFFPFWDPCQFVDDDGRFYFFWGCSDRFPLYGVEMDKATMHPLGEPTAILSGHPETIGYERTGEDGTGTAAPWIEGAFVTKYNSRYYMQYAAPGTEFNTYANGVYVSSAPLGPYTLAANNPFSMVPDGFANGAGHGSTLALADGRFVHTATMRISMNHPFERRLGLWRAGFDPEGELFCDQRYADWPIDLDAPPWSEPQWMLLSYGKSVRASSGINAACAVDENIRTWWSAASNRPGEWLEIDLKQVSRVHAVQVNFADEALYLDKPCCDAKDEEQGRYIERAPQCTRWLLEGSVDGENYFIIEDKRNAATDLPHDLVIREAGISCRFLRLTITELPYGQCARVSGLRVFGKADGCLPQVCTSYALRQGPMDMLVSWTAKDANGVCIQWGYAPDKLYHSCLTYTKNQRRITALCAEQPVWFRVDAFNGSGITYGTVQRAEQNLEDNL